MGGDEVDAVRLFTPETVERARTPQTDELGSPEPLSLLPDLPRSGSRSASSGAARPNPGSVTGRWASPARAAGWASPTPSARPLPATPVLDVAPQATRRGDIAIRRPPDSRRRRRVASRHRGRTPIEILAPCRQGPPLTRPTACDVLGFAFRWPTQEHGLLWKSGDTVLYHGVRQAAACLKG